MKTTHPVAICFILFIGFVPIQSVAQYQVNGNAAQTACNCWRLTTASNGQNGSVWNVNLFNLNNPFNFTFDVFLGCNDGGADGIAFVLQALSVNAGSSGGGIGYAGINPSLAVELDNYQNGGEPWFDHMALQSNGDVSHGGPNTLAGPVQISASTGNVEDCGWHALNIQWNPATQNFSVYFDGVLRLSYTGNIVANIFGGNPNVYWGFTSATGGANNLHQFCNSLNPAFIITSPIQCEGFPVDFESASVVATGLITAFQWDFGDGATASGTQVSHTYAAAGNYNVTLTITSEGCTQSSVVPVTINPTPSFTLGSDQSLCQGDSYQINPVGLVGGEVIQWSPVNGLDNNGIPNPIATPAATITYNLGIIDVNGCVSSDNIQITVNPLPVANAGPDQIICNAESAIMAGSGGTQYNWTPAATLSNPASANTNATPAITTIYTLTVTDANGCDDNDDMTITVNALPAVNAGADDSMCNGQNVQLGALGAMTYSWSPTSGLDDPLIANPIFSGNTTTTFTVTGTDANGCENTDDVTITVFPLPVAAFAQPADVCLGDPTLFTDNSVGAGLTFDWDFGDGSPNDPTQNPTNTYATDGNFNVMLTVMDANGCVHSANGQAVVHPLPIANAGPDQSICDGSSTLMAASGGVQYNWNPITDLVNPASPTTQASPLLTTNYTVTATDANGCVDTDDMNITVDPLPAVNAGADDSMCNGQNVQLGASGAVSYNWSPITGLSNLLIANPVFNGNLTTTFTVSGTDANGCTNTDDVTVTVFPLPVAAFAQPANSCLGNQTSFDNNSTGTGLVYSWNFGDGTPQDNSTDPTHTYNLAGNYNVVLSATDVNGCQASSNAVATVLPLPTAAMNISDGQEFCENEPIQFENESTGNIVSVLWDFGNNAFLPAFPNTTSTLQDPIFTYPNFAFSPFTVQLEVIDAAGCYDQAQVVIIIRDEPVADFAAPNVCEGAPMIFTDVSSVISAVIDTWTWNFGDGIGSSSLQNPNYQYVSDGGYQVQLSVVTQYGCSSSIIKDVRVNPTPIVSLSGIDTCLNDQTSFVNTSTPQDITIASWDWNMGDGTISAGLTATHTYPLNGVYNVSLTATTDSGCVASGNTQVEVFPNPQPAFDMVFAEGCTPHQVQFINQSTLASGFIASYDWDLGDGTTTTDGSPQHTYVDSGYYDISLSVTSAEGCNTVLTVANAIRANITPVADFSIREQELSLLDAEAVLTDQSQHALTWNWNLGDGTTSTTPSPTHVYSEPGTFDLILTVTNGDCEDTHFWQIRVEPIVTFYIPTAFTPNEDGLNETFFGVGESIITYNMKISDRWGELLFESNSPDFHWDGNFKAKPVDSGLYIYEFYLLDRFGQSHRYVGGVHLLR